MNNYFSFFQLAEHFNIDHSLLRKKYLERSRASHPDFHQLDAPHVQADAEQISALNNKAYAVLKDEDARIVHLFQIKRFLSETEENLTDMKTSPLFLAEMMDYNERIEEARLSNNPSQQEAILAEMIPIIAQKKVDLVQAITFACDQNSNDSRNPHWKKSFNFYLEYKYLLRIQNSLFNFAV